MTSEFLEVDITLSLTVQIDDVALFFTNLMGARSTMSVSDLKQIISPLLQQALSEAVGRLSTKDLVTGQRREDVESLVAKALRTSLNRYGLRFAAVQTLTIAHRNTTLSNVESANDETDRHCRRCGKTL
ncbi:MAG: SPFH domain-containing protein [Pirellulaceae bacterium]